MRNSNCDLCLLSNMCTNVCIHADVSDISEVMVILYKPSMSTDIKGRLSDREYDHYKEIFVNVCQYSIDRVYFTHLIKCYQGSITDLKDSEEACIGYLYDEIERIKPKLIIALGETVTDILFPDHTFHSTLGKKLEYKGIKTVTNYDYETIAANSWSEYKFTEYCGYFDSGLSLILEAPADIELTKGVYCRTIEDVKQLCTYIEITGRVCFDIETHDINKDRPGADHLYNKITILCMSFQHGSVYTIPFFHFESWFDQYEVAEICEILSERVFDNSDIVKYAWNAKFDIKFLMQLGIKFSGRVVDGMLMHHLYDENCMRHGLKYVASDVYPEIKGYEDAIKLSEYTYTTAPLELLNKYAITDVELTFRLCTWLETELLLDGGNMKLYRVLRNYTTPAMMLLCNMERRGMVVDKNYLLEQSEIVANLIVETEGKIVALPKVQEYIKNRCAHENEVAIRKLTTEIEGFRAKGRADTYVPITTRLDKISKINLGLLDYYIEFNIGSPKQVSDLMYSPMGYNHPKPFKYAKEGSPEETKSVAENFIQKLPDEDGFIGLLLQYRELSKLQATYLIGIHNQLDDDSVVHTSFLLAGTQTGRIASREPNLQNCFSGDTEVLTHDGWIALHHYDRDMAVAQWNIRTEEINFAAPEAIIRNADQKLLHIVNKDIDLLCTPEHVCVTKVESNAVEASFRIRTAEKYDCKGRIIKGGKFNPTGLPLSDDQVSFIALLAQFAGMHSANKDYPFLYFTAKGESSFVLIQKRLTELGVAFELRYVKYFKYRQVICIDIDNWDQEIDIHKCMAYVRYTDGLCMSLLNMNKAQREVFFSEYKLFSRRLWTDRIYVNPKDTVVIETLLATQFNSSRIVSRSKSALGANVIAILDSPYTKINKPQEYTIREVDGYHTTYCVRVATGFLLVRRKGQIYVAGNCPRTTMVGNVVKRLFVAPPKRKFCSLDYSQAELRVAAFLAGETNMINIYKDDGDIHTSVAKELSKGQAGDWDSLTKDVQKEYRTKAKGVNFGFLYGMGAKTFVEYVLRMFNMKLTLEEGEVMRKQYFSMFPKLQGWHDTYAKLVKRDKYVTDMFGGKRRLPEVDSVDHFKHSSAIRQGLNTPVQGTIGRYTIFAAVMIDLFYGRHVDLVNTVHDSLNFYLDEDLVDEYLPKVKQLAENPYTKHYFDFDLSPLVLKADVEVGDNWAELEVYGK